MAKFINLIIDPGHGGKDPGGGSNKYFKEKDLVLKISKYQQKRFKEMGYYVKLTRNSDEYLDSIPRTNRVKNSGAKYCISNHINAGGGEGAETIHSIYSNNKLAKIILDELVKEGAKYRRVFSKKGKNGDYYYMHRMTGSVETVIVEYGFADNKNDTQKLLKDWKKYAEAVIKAFCKHVGLNYIAPNTKQSNKTKKSNKNNKTNEIYRVRKTWINSKSQIGAYSILNNAKKMADKNPGYNVYDKNGKLIYKSKNKKTINKKTNSKLALPKGIYSRKKHGNRKLKAVENIQKALNSLYFKVGKVDGYYGSKTEDAVRRFQKVYDAYHVDGIYGPRVKSRMEKLLK